MDVKTSQKKYTASVYKKIKGREHVEKWLLDVCEYVLAGKS